MRCEWSGMATRTRLRGWRMDSRRKAIGWHTYTIPQLLYEEALRSCPGLFWEPICVMNHVFTLHGIGNGYDWTECGNVKRFECDEEDWRSSPRELMNSVVFRLDAHIEQFVVENARELSLGIPCLLPRNSRTMHCLQNPSDGYKADRVMFFEAPENVSQLWLIELVTFGEQWLKYMPESYKHRGLVEKKTAEYKARLSDE